MKLRVSASAVDILIIEGHAPERIGPKHLNVS
jgi:hypothetical protein